jgi:hypothetical protein
MDEILIELKLHTALLREIGANITGLRAEMKTAGKEAMEKAMKEATDQVYAMFQNTPMGPMLANMMRRSVEKSGGKHDG